MDDMILAQLEPLEEFMQDPILAIACVLLIVVSFMWIVISRRIVRNLKDAERFARSRRRRAARARVGGTSSGEPTRPVRKIGG